MGLKTLFAGTVAVLGIGMSVEAQTGQGANVTGTWYCVSNSPYVSIEVQYALHPGGTLLGQGSIVYAGTYSTYNVSGSGSWVMSPAENANDGPLVSMQLVPQAGNHAAFTIYSRPTGPNNMYNLFTNPQTGQQVTTTCQRVG